MTRESKGRIDYIPLPDATPEMELDAIVAVFAFVLNTHAKKKAAAPSGQNDGVKEESDDPTKVIIPR